MTEDGNTEGTGLLLGLGCEKVGAVKLLTPSPVNLPFALERVGDFARTVRRGESEVRCADDGAVCRECRGTYPSTGLMTTRLVPRRTARPRERV